MLIFLVSLYWSFVNLLSNTIFKLWYIFSKKTVPKLQDAIFTHNAGSIVTEILNKTTTCEAFVRAYINRLKEANTYINAIIDERFDAALKEARQIDEDIANGKITHADLEKKPFLGVPYIGKDSIKCLGMKHTLGLIARKNTVAVEDADVTRFMRNAGAILLATTSNPEVNLWQETRNYIIGQTKNPFDTSRSVGGSSGGVASAIAAYGSAIGIGTDIGGSIRMPAYFCGIFGHKASQNLISTRGLTNRTGDEIDSTMLVAGPMCRFASDIAPCLKVLTGKNAHILKLDEPTDIKKIKIYYMKESDDPRSCPIQPDVAEAFQKVVNHYESNGNEVKSVCFGEMRHSYRLWRHAMSKESFDFVHELSNRKGGLNFFSEIFKKFFGMSDYTLAAIINIANNQLLPPENPVWAEEELNNLRKKILDTLGDDGVLLYPSYPTAAPYHYVQFLRPFDFGYWAIFNALKVPVTQVPLGLNDDGLPLGIQVVASPNNDRFTIEIAKDLEKKFICQ